MTTPLLQAFTRSAAVPLCPLCHTLDRTITAEALQHDGATWNCVVCGQAWSMRRLEAVAGYAQYVASH